MRLAKLSQPCAGAAFYRTREKKDPQRAELTLAKMLRRGGRLYYTMEEASNDLAVSGRRVQPAGSASGERLSRRPVHSPVLEEA